MKKKSLTDGNGKHGGHPAKSAKGRVEKDIDDLVHSGEEDKPTELGTDDPDDAVHRPLKHQRQIDKENMEDPDDLVHGYEEEDEE